MPRARRSSLGLSPDQIFASEPTPEPLATLAPAALERKLSDCSIAWLVGYTLGEAWHRLLRGLRRR